MKRSDDRTLAGLNAKILGGYQFLACVLAYLGGRTGMFGSTAPLGLLMVYSSLVFVLLLVSIAARQFVSFAVTLMVAVSLLIVSAFLDELFLYGTRDRLVSRHLVPGLREWVLGQNEAEAEHHPNVFGGRVRFFPEVPEFVARAFGQGTHHAIFFVNDGGGRALESGGIGFSFGRLPVRSPWSLSLDDEQTFVYRTLHPE